MSRFMAVVLSAALVIPAGAGAVTMDIAVFGTGVDPVTGDLLGNRDAEENYVLRAFPDGLSSGTAIVASTSPEVAAPGDGLANDLIGPDDPWIDDNATSRWIGPDTDNRLRGPAGDYRYETTFDLTGFEASTAVLEGRFAADNSGDMFLNGTLIQETTAGFGAFTTFLINQTLFPDVFLPGENTLAFVVSNSGGATGLRVEVSGTAEMSVIPLPGAAFLLLTGIGALALPRVTRRG